MIKSTDFSKAIDLHKRFIRPINIHLRAVKDNLWLSSTSTNGLILVNKIPCAGDFEVCVDIKTLSSLVNGNRELELSEKDSRFFIKGKGIKSDIPSLTEERPRVAVVDDANVVRPADVDWLRKTLPLVTLSGLDKDGKLSAECVDGEWRISCVDGIHGACAFGKGKSKVRFTIMPSDADILRAVFEALDDKVERDKLDPAKYKVTIGYTESALIARAGDNAVSIPTDQEGAAQTHETVIECTKKVAVLGGSRLREIITMLGPIASAKEAPPVQFSLLAEQKRLKITASSSAGSIEREMQISDAKSNVKFALSYQLFTDLLTKVTDKDTLELRVRRDEDGVSRITLQNDTVHLVMLTSDQ